MKVTQTSTLFVEIKPEDAALINGGRRGRGADDAPGDDRRGRGRGTDDPVGHH